MSVALRSSLLLAPLVLVALWGIIHTPDPFTPDDDGDIELSSLPPLPGWATGKLPDFAGYRDTNEKKDAFFAYVYARTVLANSRILLERQHLEQLSRKDTLDTTETQWLARQAERLRVDEEAGSEEMFALLKRRLDAVPPSLVLAQAANESAWGTSRFARRGNNLFGQWCFSPGCGVVPNSRPEGASYEVAAFPSPYHSVRSYLQNLNRHPTYQILRDVRAQARRAGREPTGHDLAAGLEGYSERGEEYIEELRSMMSFNNLARYDTLYREKIGAGSDPAQLMQLARAPREQLLPGANKPEAEAE